MARRRVKFSTGGPRWGATKATGRQYAEMRRLKNELAKLTAENERLNREMRAVCESNAGTVATFSNQALVHALHTGEIAALTYLTKVPFYLVAELGLVDEWKAVHALVARYGHQKAKS